MVEYYARKKRKDRRYLRSRAFDATMGTTVLFLFCFEYQYMFTLQDSPTIDTDNNESNKLSRKRPNLGAPYRNGLVPRRTLRSSSLHESDAFLDGIYPTKTKMYRKHPRVVALGENGDMAPVNHILTSTRTQNTTIYSSTTTYTTEEAFRDFERPFFEECEQLVHPKIHPTCNFLHEKTIESDATLVSTAGSWRTTWKLEGDEVALKMLNYDRSFDEQSVRAHAVDAIVMDQLTASPYTVNAYGFCGQSVLTEWASLSGRDHVKSYDTRNRARLKMARDLARGLADLQAFRHLHSYKITNRTALFAHNDINIANTIYVGGMVKWNDFNIGVFLRNEKNDMTQSCGSPVRFRGDLWRSPEEVKNTSFIEVEQSDIYSFGNVLYQVMTRHQPWTHHEPGGKLAVEEVASRKKRGRWPTIPEKYMNTTKPELIALYAATVSCFHPNPSKRLTAFELSNSFEIVYNRLKNKQSVPRMLLGQLFFKN